MRSPLLHCLFSGHDMKSLHKISKCCPCRWDRVMFHLRLNDCWNLRLACAILLISLTEGVSRVSLSRLWQLVNLHLLWPKTLHALLYSFGDCANHPARFVIFAQLAQPWNFFINVVVVPIILIVGSCKMAQTVSHSIKRLLQCSFGLPGCQSPLFSNSHILLLMLDHYLSIFNSLSCHGGFSVQRIIDEFPLIIVVWNMQFLSFLRHKMHFRSYDAQCSKGSDPLRFQAALASIFLMTSSSGPLCGFAAFTRQKWRQLPFQSFDQDIVCWHCSLARCWMLKDTDHKEAHCILYFTVVMLAQLEQSKISVLTFTTLGRTMLTVQRYMMFRVCFM